MIYTRRLCLPYAGTAGARTKGDIQQGHTGDKKQGFDPAAKPFEADASAAGTPSHPAPTQGVRAAVSSSPILRSLHGTAMQRLDAEHDAQSPRLPLGAVALVVAILLDLLMFLS